MGYHTSPRLILENLDLLVQIKEAVKEGKELRFKVRDDNEISSEQYRLRRMLAATDRHRSTYGGEFAGLGASVSVRVEAEKGIILIKPKQGVALEEYRPDESNALEYLEEAKGSLAMVEFWPSKEYKITSFIQEGLRRGWVIIPSTRMEEDDGKITFAAERKDASDSEEFSGFSAIG